MSAPIEVTYNDLVMEAIYESGDPDAHATMPDSILLTREIDKVVQDYLEEARDELCKM